MAACACDRPEPCDMRYGEPYDFAWCETHDTTFPLGSTCEWDGVESIVEHLYEQIDALRQRAVLAEMRNGGAV